MTEHPRITRIDQNDQLSLVGAEAERRFFEYYGLDLKVHSITVKHPNIRVRVTQLSNMG